MKKSFFIILLIPIVIAFQSCGSMVKSNLEPMENVVPVENTSKDVLYVRANNWMVSVFNDAESVIQFADKESGTVTGKYKLATSYMVNGGDMDYPYAIIHIQLKQGASKITITPQNFEYYSMNTYSPYSDEKTREEIDFLMLSFENAITNGDKENW